MTIKTFAGVAAVAALIATPAMAQHASMNVHRHGQTGLDKTKSEKMQIRHVRESHASLDRPASGFAPLDFAAGVAGGAVIGAAAVGAGAVSAAGTIADAPFTPWRNDTYASYRGGPGAYGPGYIVDANGPTCIPGQLTTINGRPMICQ